MILSLQRMFLIGGFVVFQACSIVTVWAQSTYDGATQCTICGTGSVMRAANKSLFFVGGSLTCDSANNFLNGAEAAADCTSRTSDIQRIPIDLASWCECDGVTQPNVCPELCSDGGMVLDAEQEIQIQNETWTCAEAQQLDLYVNDADFCDALRAESFKCCAGAPIPPTPTPTNRPTTARQTAAPEGESSSSATTTKVTTTMMTNSGLFLLINVGVFLVGVVAVNW